MKTSACNFRAICSSFVIPLLALVLASTASTVHAQDTFCIPPHEGLPHHGSLPPTVDGYAGFVTGVPTLATDPIEQGWVRSGLNSYAYGGTGAWMELRGIRHNSQPFVYFSFVVQNDQAFDADDSIVLVLDPGWVNGATSFTSSARRVEIRPVVDGAGAPGVIGDGPNLIRTNRVPFAVAWKRFQTGAWTAIAPPDGADIKVRSWEMPPSTSDKGWSVEVKLPTNAVAGWVNLGSTFGIYANVIKVCGSGNCVLDPVIVQDFFSNQFTWPRTTSYDPMSPGFRAITGSFLTLSEAFDSIPARYLGPATTTASTCRGVRFAGGAGGIGVRSPSGTLGTNIDATAGVTNTLVARLQNDGTANDGRGIQAEFRIANWGVSGGPGTWDLIPARPTSPPNLPAGPLNGGMANGNASARVDVPVTSSSDIWMQTQILPTDNYCNPSLTACPAGSRSAHSCILVLLNSNQNANIWESSVRRNFDITNLSVKRQQAEISGKGWEKGTGPGGAQEFTLTTQRRFLVHPGRVGNIRELQIPKGIVATALMEPNEKLRPVELIPALELDLLKMPDKSGEALWNYIWEVNASRSTFNTLKVGQKTYRVMEPAGTFGTIGQHSGVVAQFVDQISTSSALTSVANTDMHRAVVANGGALRFGTMLGALAQGEAVPPEETPKPNGGCGTFSGMTKVGAHSGGATLAGSLLMVGGLGVGGLAFLRRRKPEPAEVEDKETQS